MRKLRKSELSMVSGSLSENREKEMARDLIWNASSTRVIVAHRETTIKSADRIVNM
ncbi:secretion ATPase [Ursidibacter arcticus]